MHGGAGDANTAATESDGAVGASSSRHHYSQNWLICTPISHGNLIRQKTQPKPKPNPPIKY